MSELKFNAVNVSVDELEEERERNNNAKLKTQFKTSFDPKNYLNLRLGENEASRTFKVRLLPVSPTDGRIFLPILTHSLKVDKEVAQSGFKTYVCLNDDKVKKEGCECPICKKVSELYNEAAKAASEGKQTLADSLKKEARSIKKKTTYIVRVIDREHENEGVKFWRFNENSLGKGIYDQLMQLDKTRNEESLADDGVKYSIFDLYEGKDIIINVTKTKREDGKDALAYTITDSGNRKSLTKDVEQGNAWLNDPKTWQDVYSNKTADYLELVVNGKVPVYNRDLGKFVEKVANEKQNKHMEEEVASAVLMANNDNVVNTHSSDDEDDLPF